MTKHTPGPWTIVPYGDGDSLVIHADQSEWRICFMATPGASPGAMGRIEANARLIAAAPEMLEALKSVDGMAVLALRGRTIKEYAIPASVLEQVIATIAKAEGQQ